MRWVALVSSGLVGSSVLLAGCPSSVSCGPGTHLEGSVCVLDATTDAGPVDAALSPSADAGPVDAFGGGGADAPSGRLDEGDPCPTDGAGHTTLSPQCDGDDLLYCNGARVRRTDCTELGDRCVPAATPSDLPRCEGGVYVACSVATTRTTCADEGHALLCSGGYPHAPGYTYTIPCESFGEGYSCAMGTTESGCVPPGTVACDPSMPSSECSEDGSAIVRCSDGLQLTIPCEDRMAGSVCDLGPGDEPVCVPEGAPRCDPRTFHGSCLGERTIEWCDTITYHAGLYGCEAGTRCRVSELGFAACVPDEALSCDPETHEPRCLDASRLARCDNRGFESSVDCRPAGPAARCIPDVPARCGDEAICDVATYAARCEGETALNCRAGGWVESRACSPFIPCRVAEGEARCGG